VSIYETDKQSAKFAKAPRIALKDIEDQIAYKFDLNGKDIIPYAPNTALASLEVLSICMLIMKNGFVVIGKSAPMSSENYNFALGQQFAYEDAIRQLWPLMAFSAKDKVKDA